MSRLAREIAEAAMPTKRTAVVASRTVSAEPDLVALYGDMVRAIAGSIRRELDLQTELEELAQDGFLGLVEAWNKWDESRGVPFEAFARYRVVGAIYDGVRRRAPFARRLHERLKRAEAARTAAEARDLADRSDHDPRDDEESLFTTFSDVLGDATRAFEAAALAQQEGYANPEEALITEVERERIRQAHASLPEDEEDLVRRVFFEGATQDAVAEHFGVDPSHISRALRAALGRLKKRLGDR